MIEARLADLRRKFESGQKLLRELEAKHIEVRDTMLVGAAMQVLEELLADATTPELRAERSRS